MRITEHHLFIPKNKRDKLSFLNKKQRTYSFSPLSNTIMPIFHKDIVSFSAMKKSHFDVLDIAVIERFKIPIEKFNTTEDLQNWSSERIKKIIERDYGGKSKETRAQRKYYLRNWIQYLQDENNHIKPSVQLLVLNSITKELKYNEEKIPPLFSEQIFQKSIQTIKQKLQKDIHHPFNFANVYHNEIEKTFFKEEGITPETSMWIVLPSQTHDPENYEKNVEKLKLFSSPKWCTKLFKAAQYLLTGDFHIYMDRGKAQLGLRFNDSVLTEIQGYYNDGTIPLEYFNILKKHIIGTILEEEAKTAYDKANIQQQQLLRS